MAAQQQQEVLAEIEVETPADFLVKLRKAIRENVDADVGLVDILAEHLLIATPHVGAVSAAKDAILKLAAERANPPKPEVAGG